MSQEYFPATGSSSASKDASSSHQEHDEQKPSFPNSWAAPQYMTVGNGARPAAAEALISSLNHDSGYGGSVAGDGALEGDLTDWQAGMLEDRPTPAHTPRETGPEGMYQPSGFCKWVTNWFYAMIRRRGETNTCESRSSTSIVRFHNSCIVRQYF